MERFKNVLTTLVVIGILFTIVSPVVFASEEEEREDIAFFKVHERICYDLIEGWSDSLIKASKAKFDIERLKGQLGDGDAPRIEAEIEVAEYNLQVGEAFADDYVWLYRMNSCKMITGVTLSD